MKLRVQLALLVTCAVVFSLAIAMGLTGSLTRAALEADARSAALEAADDIARTLEKLPPLTDEGIERRLEQALRKHPRLTDVELELENGPGSSGVSQYQLRSRADALVKKQSESGRRTGPRTLSATVGESGAPDIEVSTPLDGRIGRGRVTVTLSLASVDRIAATQSRIAWTVGLVALGLVLALTWFAFRRLVGRPLERLESAMGRVAEGLLDRPVDTDGPPEVRAVGESFNRMLDRLAEADREVRSFNGRLRSEVQSATQELSTQNQQLAHLNALLVRAREDLAHKERLAALGQLAAQLAHEVGTPLGTVSGQLQLALSRPDLSSSTQDRLRIAVREIDRVSSIIRDYLDSTRRVEPSLSEVDVARLVSESIEIARGGQPSRGAPVDVEIAPGARQWLTDEGALRQILVNLLSNALDAQPSAAVGPDRHRVSVIAAVQQRPGPEGVSPRPSGLLLAVRDTGIGLSTEQLDHIFEPFYTTKGRGRGTGLGLAICRELARSLSGTVAAEGTPGAGATFSIWIPSAEAAAQRATSPPGATARLDRSEGRIASGVSAPPPVSIDVAGAGG